MVLIESLCQKLCQGVCCVIESSGIIIIITIPILQMRKLRLAQRLGLESESAKVLDARAPTPSVTRDLTARSLDGAEDFSRVTGSLGQPWAKQGSHFLGPNPALSPHIDSWARPAPWLCAFPRKPKRRQGGSSDNKGAYMELKQNTSDAQKCDSRAAALP